MPSDAFYDGGVQLLRHILTGQTTSAFRKDKLRKELNIAATLFLL